MRIVVTEKALLFLVLFAKPVAVGTELKCTFLLVFPLVFLCVRFLLVLLEPKPKPSTAVVYMLFVFHFVS